MLPKVEAAIDKEIELLQTKGATLPAANIMSGTKTRTTLTIAKTLENRGAGLAFGASREGVGVGGNALSNDLPILLQTFYRQHYLPSNMILAIVGDFKVAEVKGDTCLNVI